MLERIITGWDGTDAAEDALALADALGRPGSTQILLARVMPRAARHDDEGERLAELTRTAGAVGASAEVVPGDSPAEGLADLASELHAGLVVVGSSDRGWAGRVLAGDVGVGLMRRSPSPVAVAPRAFRRRYAPGPRVIGVGFDGSAEARAALDGAARLAVDRGAELRIVGIVETEPLAARASMAPSLAIDEAIRSRREQLARDIDEALADLSPAVPATGAVLTGEPSRVLADKSAAGFDLLVVGSHGRGRPGRAVLGSVPARLARSLSSPLLVYPRGAGLVASAPPATEYAA